MGDFWTQDKSRSNAFRPSMELPVETNYWVFARCHHVGCQCTRADHIDDCSRGVRISGQSSWSGSVLRPVEVQPLIPSTSRSRTSDPTGSKRKPLRSQVLGCPDETRADLRALEDIHRMKTHQGDPWKAELGFIRKKNVYLITNWITTTDTKTIDGRKHWKDKNVIEINTQVAKLVSKLGSQTGFNQGSGEVS